MESLPTVILRPGEADRVLTGHPWIYQGSVLRTTREVTNGEVVQVKDHRQRFLGVGFYNARSKIIVRMLSPERTAIDADFFQRRIHSALNLRKRLMPTATSYRLVNAESDCLSGLIVDVYEDVAVIQTSSLGMDQRKPMILEALKKNLKLRAVIERNEMASRKFEGLEDSSGILDGKLDDSEMGALPVKLNGLTFEINLKAGHKTGLYLDQQSNYARVAELAKGGRVLDAFSFLGGFSVHAARAGAARVEALDQSEDAVTAARRIAGLNGCEDRCNFTTANVFDWLKSNTTPAPHEKIIPSFDLIILDPPSFTRNRASVGDALRGYKEIHLRALKLLKPTGTLVTFCCSHHVSSPLFEEVIQSAACDARKLLRRTATYTQSPDHPVVPAIPETEYLKGFAYELVW